MTVTSPKSPYHQKINNNKNNNKNINKNKLSRNEKLFFPPIVNDLVAEEEGKDVVKSYQYFHVLAVIQIQRTYRGFLVRCREWNFNLGNLRFVNTVLLCLYVY